MILENSQSSKLNLGRTCSNPYHVVSQWSTNRAGLESCLKAVSLKPGSTSRIRKIRLTSGPAGQAHEGRNDARQPLHTM